MTPITRSIAIDPEPPQLAPAITPTPGASGWYTAPITVSFVLTDLVSGPAGVTWRLNNSPPATGNTVSIVQDGPYNAGRLRPGRGRQSLARGQPEPAAGQPCAGHDPGADPAPAAAVRLLHPACSAAVPGQRHSAPPRRRWPDLAWQARACASTTAPGRWRCRRSFTASDDLPDQLLQLRHGRQRGDQPHAGDLDRPGSRRQRRLRRLSSRPAGRPATRSA